MSATGTAGRGDELNRLRALHAYRVLDTPPEGDFDDIAVLAAHVCHTPIALFTLVDHDRQWFKARVGLDTPETARAESFCAYAMHRPGITEIPDARLDTRFARNPFVAGEPHVRFYAGAPVISPAGHPLGALCVLDHAPRALSGAEHEALGALARHVGVQLELRRYARAVRAVHRDGNRLKEELTARVTHDAVDLSELANNAADENRGLAAGKGLSVSVDITQPALAVVDRARVGQALDRLILNAIKFTDRGGITIAAGADGARARLEVRDTGIGIEVDERVRILAPFGRGADAERREIPGAGLGLTVVKAIVDGHGGTLTIDGGPGSGTNVRMSFPQDPDA